MKLNDKINISYIKCVLFIAMLFCTISIGTAKEPFDSQAGFTAYVNVGSGIDVDTATNAYDSIQDLSESHAVGIINIVNADGSSDSIKVYVDSNGWIAAYLDRGNYYSLMQFAGMDYTNPAFHSTLEDAISRVCGELGISYDTVDDNIKFYDFGYPEATNFTVTLNVLDDDVTSEKVFVVIPNTYTDYVNVCYLYNPIPGGLCNAYLDNDFMCNAGNYWSSSRSSTIFGLSLDSAHVIKLEDGNGVLGNKHTMAILMIYK